MLGKDEGGKEDWETGKSGSTWKEWPVGNWSNSRHTWVTSLHHSNWHGKAYGLEMDPSTACMPRGTHTKISQSGSPKDFGHANKFLILAPDDHVFTGGVVLHCTRQGRSVYNGKAVTNELTNTDVVMNEMLNALQFLRQIFKSSRIRRQSRISSRE